MGQHAMHLARRINLLRRRMDGGGVDDLSALPKTPFPSALLATPTIDEISQKLSELYLYYLLWRPSDTSLNDEVKDLQTWLKHILTLDGATLNWVAAWVNVSTEVPAVTLADYWPGIDADPSTASVQPAFTTRGKAAIDDDLAEIEKALFEPLAIGSQKLAFKTWYQRAYRDAWRDFAAIFPEAPAQLGSRDHWKEAGVLMPTQKGPYLALLDSLATELVAIGLTDKAPDWLDLVMRFKQIRLQADIDAKGGKAAAATNFIQKATDSVSSRINRVETATGTDAETALRFEDRMAAAKAFLTYRDALASLAPMMDSRKVAFNMASALYNEDPAEGDSPFFKARQAKNALQTILGRENKDTTIFWNLVNGPIRFYHQYALQDAQCQLQSLWEKDVYLEVQDLPSSANLNELLMGSDGFAVKFIKGPAAPFVGRSRGKGYYARKVDDLAMDIDTRFLTFLTRGASVAKPVASEFNVTIRAYPTDANQNAAIKPHATSLEVQCGDERNRLLNLHYPVKKTFHWSPRSCGDVVFKIEIGNLVLTRVYSGYLGFAKFLKDFETGQHTFRPADFPDSAAALRRMGITSITPRYQFSGHRPVIGLIKASPGRLPQDIVSCWGK
jgi:type VI secretion system protein ImpL